VFSRSVSFDWGNEAAAGIAANPAITAAFCTADLIAAGLLAGLHKLGKRIPEDVSVMGFDNLSVSRMVYPALTTVDQSIAEKGRLAGELIASILDKRDTARKTVVPTTVIERDSVMRRRWWKASPAAESTSPCSCCYCRAFSGWAPSTSCR
jgi:LacI family transcriptional regulator